MPVRQLAATMAWPGVSTSGLEITYRWIPHNASFGFLDLAPSIRHSNWFWDYIS
jgi:hypothetical protein